LSKQEQILSAALRLFVADGFHGTPTSKIAHEADVANGTLFHHYKTKEDLIIALYNRIKDELANDISAIIKEEGFITYKLRKIFEHSIYWALNNPDKFYYIQQFNFSPHLAKVPPEVLKQQTSAYTQLIITGIAKKLLRQQPVELIAAMLNGQVYGIYQYLITSDVGPEEQKKIIEEAYEMVWVMLKYM
jgi:AcrR family transcriptional regulator